MIERHRRAEDAPAKARRARGPRSNGDPRRPLNGTGFVRRLAQARRWAHPLPTQSPTIPTLRANPYPEVTDPICRLPLPTLFHRPEAVNLGDLLRIWVRAGASPPSPPRDFQGPAGRSWMPRELRHSSPEPKPILPARGFQGLGGLCRKDNSSQSSSGRLPVASRCHDGYEVPNRFRDQVPEYGPDSLSALPWQYVNRVKTATPRT